MSKRIPEHDASRRTRKGRRESSGDDDLLEYAATRDTQLRSRLVLRYGPLVTQVAGKLAAALPAHVDRADLVSAGTLGLYDALDRYDPGKGRRFEPFAVGRIRGAMLDEVRAAGHLPRSFWSRRRELDRAAGLLGRQLGRGPDTGELAAMTGMPAALVVRVGQEDVRQREIGEVPDDEAVRSPFHNDLAARDPEQAAVDADARRRLRWAIDSLPDRSRQLIAWHYLEGRTLAHIAGLLGVTDGRAAQIHGQALRALRAWLREH
ncbi:MAG TPA: sigma-70 family RNA polymerase sigma factor [Streptosporangiales bacterium]